MLETALAYRQAGRSVLPIAPGEKRPSIATDSGKALGVAWDVYKKTRADETTIHSWFPPGQLMGIGIACGPVSGMTIDGVPYGLEIIDIDDAETLDAFNETANFQGLSALLERLLHQRTPGGAGHYAYLCQTWAGNQKLAQRQDGVDANNKPIIFTLIETRGEGGQAVVAPTPPGIHPEVPERGYTLVRGDWEHLPIITPEERHTLLDLARSFHTYAAPEMVRPRPGESRGTFGKGDRPGDQLNGSATPVWWRALLERHDWTLVYERNTIQYWRRPGKDGKAWSATLGACGPYLYVFSSNASPFEPEKAYSPFFALALLDHGGDFAAAARVLMVRQFAEAWPEAVDLVPLLERQMTTPDSRAVFDAASQFARLGPETWGACKRVLKGLVGAALNLAALDKCVKQARNQARRTAVTGAGTAPPDEDEPSQAGDRVGSYQATSTGLVWWKPLGGDAIKVPLTNFTARIVGDVVEDDGAETRRYFELEACHQGGTIRFPVEAAHFAGMTWALEHLGARAAVYPGMMLKDHARMAVQMFSQEVHTRHIYTHLGWRKIDETWCYLHAGGAIGPNGLVSSVEVKARHSLAAYVFPPLPGIEDQRAALCASLRVLDTAADVVTIPLFAAIWRAVLGNADFSLHLVGPTGAGKSELVALAQQHYGAGMTARNLPAAWTSTGNALEGLAFEAKDVLLVVDDFCPSGSQADIARFHKDADRLLRAQGNHSGRQRMRFDGTLRAAKPPRGLIVSTGEDTPQGQSLRARLLILDMAPDSVHWSKLSSCQADAANEIYAQTLAGFVRWLAPHYEHVQQGLHAEIITLRQAALSNGHRRTPEIIGNLALAMQYFLAYAYDSDAMTLEECTTLWQRSWTALGQAGEAQSEQQVNEEPVRRFFSLLTGALAAGLAHVADSRTLDAPLTNPGHWGWRGMGIGERDEATMQWYLQGTRVGWLHGDRLYLEGEAAFSVVQKLAESQKAPLAITQHTLWKRMHEQGLLRPDPERGRNKVRQTIGSERRYVVDVSASCVSILSTESGPTGPIGPIVQQPQQKQGTLVGLFPFWYQQKAAHSVATKAAHSSSARTEEVWAAFAPVSGPLFSTESAHKNDLQAQQNQECGPFGPVGPLSQVYSRQLAVPLSVDAHQREAKNDDTSLTPLDPSIPETAQQACSRCGEVTLHVRSNEGGLACTGCNTLPDSMVLRAENGGDDEELVTWTL